MHFSVELDSVHYHECNIILKGSAHLVLVPLRLVLHVFKCDWLLDDVAIIWRFLPARLVVEEVRVRADHQLLYDLHEDDIEALRSVLLLPPSALVRWLRCVLEVIVAESVRLEL